MIDAVRALKPLQQGECDYLCGVYSIINAIRLASHPAPVDAHQLFAEAIEYLVAKDRLAEVMRHGMGTGVWRRLLRHLLSQQGLPIQLEAVSCVGSGASFKTILHDAVLTNGPVLFELDGQIKHFTVAVGITNTRLILFDSDRLKWMRLKSISMASEKRTTRYQIVEQSIVALKPNIGAASST